MDAYYKEDWSNEDKEMFDLMVKEEMDKLKKGLPSMVKSNPNNDDYYEQPLLKTTDRKPVQLQGFEKALQKNDGEVQRLNKSAVRKNDINSDDNSGFVSKLGEYDNSKNNVDARKARQIEYANMLQQQMSQGYDSKNNLDGRKSDSKIRRSNGNSDYDNSGTGFVIGADPNVQKQIERNKRLEYSKLLEEQIDYQKSSPSKESKSYIGTRSIQNYDSYQDNNVSNNSYVNPNQYIPRRSPSPITHSNVDNNSFEEKKMRQAKYAEDLRRDAQVKLVAPSGRREQNNGIFNANNSNTQSYNATLNIPSHQDDSNSRKKDKQQEYYRQLAEASQQPRIVTNRMNSISRDNDELPGGGFLSIGENKQGNVRTNNGRSSHSIEEQEEMIKRKESQKEYYRKLQEDTENISSVVNSNIPNSIRRNSSARASLNIGDDNVYMDAAAIRKKKQQEYAEALALDAMKKPPDVNSLERKPSRLRSNASNSSGYDGYQGEESRRGYSNNIFGGGPEIQTSIGGRGRSTGGGTSSIVFG